MKKRILSMLLVIVLVLSVVPVQALAAGEFTITPSKKNVVIDKDEITLTAENGTPVEWKAEATGNGKGEVTLTPAADKLTCKMVGKTQGKVKVTATDADGNKASVNFTVYQKPTNLTIYPEVATMTVGDEPIELDYNCTNKDNLDPVTKKWSITSGGEFLEIDANGLLTAKAAGDAVVRLAVNGVAVTMNVTVNAKTTDPVTPSEPSEPGVQETYKITVDGEEKSEIAVYVDDAGKVLKLIDSTGAEVSSNWKSTDPAVAEVVEGQLTIKGTGTCTINAKKSGNVLASLVVTVQERQTLTGIAVPDFPESIYAGEELPLSVQFTPADYEDQNITWSSDKPAVAEVKDGVLIAKKAGKAEISAISDNNPSVVWNRKLTVKRATKIVVSEITEKLLAGDKLILKADLLDMSDGGKKLNAPITWELAEESDTDFVTLSNGTLYARADLQGTYDITLKASVDSTKYDAKPVEDITITVVPKAKTLTLTVDGKKVNDTVCSVNLEKDEDITIEAAIAPAAAEQDVVWEISGGAGIFTKEEEGNELTLTPNGTGKTGDIQVTAVAVDGTKLSATTTVRFEKVGTTIQFGEDDILLRGGASANLYTYLELGENVNASAITWKLDGNVVNGKKIASITKAGKLTTKAVTKETIVTVTATNTASGKKAELTVYLYPATKSITVSGAAKTIKFKNGMEPIQLSAAVKPAAIEGIWDLKWSSSDNRIAAVDSEGVLTIKDAGKVRITCQTTDGSNVKGYLYLEVTKDAANVKITAPSKTLNAGKSMDLTATVMAGKNVKAANQEVTWSVADEYGQATAAATISATGRLMAYDVAENTVVVVTATSAENDEVFGTYQVTIKPNTKRTLHVYADDEIVNDVHTMNLNDSCVLEGKWQITANGNDCEAKNCTFFSSNTGVARVDEETGMLEAVGYGNATITVRCYEPGTNNLYTATFQVKVANMVGAVTINTPVSTVLRGGQQITMSATAWTDRAAGIKAENQSFDWEVKVWNDAKNAFVETDVVSIDAKGVLRVTKVDAKYQIQVKAVSKENSSLYDTHELEVYPADSVQMIFELDGEEYDGVMPVNFDEGIGGLKAYTRAVYTDSKGNIHDEITDVTELVDWTSSNTKVISLDKNKKNPELKGVGSTVLTAKGKMKINGKDCSFEGRITVNVNRLVGEIKIEQSNILVSGKSANMRVKVGNANATNQNVVWSVAADKEGKESTNGHDQQVHRQDHREAGDHWAGRNLCYGGSCGWVCFCDREIYDLSSDQEG